MPGARCRLVNAIWYSYSKSETVRTPRSTAPIFCARQKSTTSPRNVVTDTRLSFGSTSRSISTRSSGENVGALLLFTATATVR